MRTGIITENFTFAEFYRTSTGKPNIPTDADGDRVEYLTRNLLQPLRDYYGAPLVVSSGFRSPAVNKAVGGSATSLHLRGAAADIDCGNNASKALLLASYALKNLPFNEIIVSRRGLHYWVHFSLMEGSLLHTIAFIQYTS